MSTFIEDLNIIHRLMVKNRALRRENRKLKRGINNSRKEAEHYRSALKTIWKNMYGLRSLNEYLFESALLYRESITECGVDGNFVPDSSFSYARGWWMTQIISNISNFIEKHI